MTILAESTKTYTERIDFWYWGKLFALANLVDSAGHYCLELIESGHIKLDCNKALPSQFNINKRWSNSIYTEVLGIIDNAKENREKHINILLGQIKFLKSDIKKRSLQIKDFVVE